MKTFKQFVYPCLGVIVFAAVCQVDGDSAVFFDEKNYGGNSLDLTISGGCYKMKKKWIDRVTSMQLDPESCIIAWKNDDCTGHSIKVHPSSAHANNLGDVDFDNKIKSVSLCVEISFRHMDNDLELDVSDRMGGSGEVGGGNPHKVEVNFYEEPDYGGSILTLGLYPDGECYNFKRKWATSITSMELNNACIRVWETKDCEGPFVTLNSGNTSPQEFRNLKRIKLAGKIKSTRLCPQSPQRKGQAPSAGGKGGGNFRRPGSENDGHKRPKLPTHTFGPTQDITSDREVMEVSLKEHNKYRRMHGVPSLQWDEALQKTAQSYANYLASNNKFEHSNDNFELGENLAGTTTENKGQALREAMEHWYHEIHHYNFNNPDGSTKGIKAGHFTQLVWKSTTHFAVGMAWNKRRGWWVIVGNYSPAGNFKGEYGDNVFPPKRV